MQNPAGHRINIHNPDFKEVGIGVINGINGSVGPQVVTQDLGNPGDVRYITGVVYEDLNGNQFYDLGEGRSDVRVDVDGVPFYALSSTSGGYSIPVLADGMYEVMFSGGGYATWSASAIVSSGLNVKLDYLVSTVMGLTGDYNDDGVVNAADYVVWRNNEGTTNTLANDPIGGTIGEDQYNQWRDNFGNTPGVGAVIPRSAVPEPTAAPMCLSVLSALALLRGGRRPRRQRSAALLKR
jgi:hypothetical protein